MNNFSNYMVMSPIDIALKSNCCYVRILFALQFYEKHGTFNY